MNKTNIIAIIGCGNMSMAMLGGLAGSVIDSQSQFRCSSRSIESAEKLASSFQSAQAMTDNAAAVLEADKVILSVKPQQAEAICREIAPHLSKHCHVISVMAGVSSATLAHWCGIETITRIMPNTPASVGRGMAGVYHSLLVKEEDKVFIHTMITQVGQYIEVDNEEKMHVITAVSGSGVAYFFHFMHHMQAVAMHLGFTASEAKQLVSQTALGAAELVQQSEKSALQLQQNVCSPGGTTVEAIAFFEQANMAEIIDGAMRACHEKSIALSKT